MTMRNAGSRLSRPCSLDEWLPPVFREAIITSPYFRENRISIAAVQAGFCSPYTVTGRIAAEFPGESTFLWVKRYLAKPSHAAREYDFLREARIVFEDKPGLKVVEPLAAIESLGLIVTREAPGVTLSSVLARAQRRLASLRQVKLAEEYCRQAGRWLGYFHEGSPRPGDWANLDQTVRLIEHCLKWAEIRWGIAPDLRTDCLAILRTRLSAISPCEAVRVKTHGDYAPHNLVVEPLNLTVIDPSFPPELQEQRNHCCRMEDAARFCVAILGNSPRTLQSPRRESWLKAFVEGYNQSSGAAIVPWSPVWNLFFTRHLLLSLKDWTGELPDFWRAARWKKTLGWVLNMMQRSPCKVTEKACWSV